MESIIKAIKNLTNLTSSEMDLLRSGIKSSSIKKGDFLLREGQICEAFYHVSTGSIRRYQIKTNGLEITKAFYLENDWALDAESFTGRKGTLHFFQANEKCQIEEIHLQFLHELIDHSRSFLQLGTILQTSLSSLHPWTDEPPEKRYRNLLLEKPEILQRFSLKHIASWLKMTPENA